MMPPAPAWDRPSRDRDADPNHGGADAARLTVAPTRIPDPDVCFVGVHMPENETVSCCLLVGRAGAIPSPDHRSVFWHLERRVNTDQAARAVFGAGGLVSYRLAETETVAGAGAGDRQDDDDDCAPAAAASWQRVPAMQFTQWRRRFQTMTLWTPPAGPDPRSGAAEFMRRAAAVRECFVYLFQQGRWLYRDPLAPHLGFTRWNGRLWLLK